MESISWTKKKANEDVYRIVIEKHALIEVIKTRRWKMIGQALRYSEELHNIIIVGIIEGKETAGHPRYTYIRKIKRHA